MELPARAVETLVLLHLVAEQLTHQPGDGRVLLRGLDSGPARDFVFECDGDVSQPSHYTILVLHEHRVKTR